MNNFIKKLYDMGIEEERVKIIESNAVQIIKDNGCLIISKGAEDNFTIVSIIENQSLEEVLKFVEEYK